MHDLIMKAVGEGRNLSEPEAMQLFSDHGLPVPVYKVVKTEEEAAEASREIGFPVVLKIVSFDVLHKTDAGGVKTGLLSTGEVSKAFKDIMNSVKSLSGDVSIEGMLVVKHVSDGFECIVGMTKDPHFGPALMFGPGGIFVELLKDVSFRVLPINRNDAEEMVKETTAYKLLGGVRGNPPADIPSLIDFLLKTASLVEQNPQIGEIDLNPILVGEAGVLILDARVILDKS